MAPSTQRRSVPSPRHRGGPAGRAWAVALLLALSAPVASRVGAQEPGLLTGVVMDDLTGAVLAGARVSVPSLQLGAVSNEAGEFSIAGLPVGTVPMRFEAEGYMSVTEEVELTGASFLSVRLSPVKAVLDEVLVVAGRRARARGEVGVAEEETAWRSVLDLIESQVPSVVVQRGGGNMGTGAYLYLRGVSSFQQDLAPEVYLDGIRLDGGNTGTRSLHILDLIPARSVAKVQVLRGGAAATAYPLAAANGVIVIETHRGWQTGR